MATNCDAPITSSASATSAVSFFIPALSLVVSYSRLRLGREIRVLTRFAPSVENAQS